VNVEAQSGLTSGKQMCFYSSSKLVWSGK